VNTTHPGQRYHHGHSKANYDEGVNNHEHTIELVYKRTQRVRRDFFCTAWCCEKGYLDITSGISNFDLTGDPATQDLFRSQFVGQIPDVRTRNERVTIHYQRSVIDWFKHLFLMNRHVAKVLLNTSIPWQIEIRGGVANMNADLWESQLRSLIVTGGIAETHILLPRPLGTVPIHLASGVSQLTLIRPEAVSARLKIDGGVSNLDFDDRYYSSIGGGIRLERPDYKDETNRYDITIRGGVSNLIIRTQA
jgi:hypothetical protein